MGSQNLAKATATHKTGELTCSWHKSSPALKGMETGILWRQIRIQVEDIDGQADPEKGNAETAVGQRRCDSIIYFISLNSSRKKAAETELYKTF